MYLLLIVSYHLLVSYIFWFNKQNTTEDSFFNPLIVSFRRLLLLLLIERQHSERGAMKR